MNKRYFRGSSGTDPQPSPDEFPKSFDLSSERATRRSFLKLAGFAAGVAATGCSRTGPYHAIPFLNKPPEMTPGVSNWYATMCGGCDAGCGVLAKSRDGRPIKIEGNPDHPVSRGGVCAPGQAYLLGLYDTHRLDGPRIGNKASSWETVDQQIVQELGAIRQRGGKVRILTGTKHGPTERAAIDQFVSAFPGARHVMVDALSASAMLDVHKELFGVRAVPRYHLDRAKVIVSFDADFLGTWISPVEFTRAYRAGRNPDGDFSHHTQFEAHLSLTGSNADERVVTAPHEIGAALRSLCELVARKTKQSVPWQTDSGAPVALRPQLEQSAARLANAPRGETLVLCGTNDIGHQRYVAFLNDLLGNYGATADLKNPSRQRLGDDRALEELRAEIARDEVDALFVAGCNPLYDRPNALALDKVPLTVSFADHIDETAVATGYVCPDHHSLESWRDGEAIRGVVTVSQPLVNPLKNTRSMIESLALWRGEKKPARDLMRETWRTVVFPRASIAGSFDAFWNQAVHDGFAKIGGGETPRQIDRSKIKRAPDGIAPESGGLAVVLHPQVAMLDGRHAHNAWLHELPDPVSKLVWDNVAALAPATAERLGVEDGDLVRVTVNGAGVTLPAFSQPGTHPDVVAIALGYGRTGTGRFHDVGPDWIEGEPTVAPGKTVGANAAPLIGTGSGYPSFGVAGATVSVAGGHRDLASTQLYHSLTEPEHLGGARRPHVHETTVAHWNDKDHSAGHGNGHEAKPLWPDDHDTKQGRRWGMAIDLTACTGCSACVLSCQAENNVPVVGRDEVRRQRDMHWMRIDRYYSGDTAAPDVVHQPMLCQHCDNAPCESVCPVLATVHSSEGLNQQVYNRCVGTRYCANNCPYKVRRFNWFDYAHEDQLQNLVLNPDISVRMRGVMEKCSFCVQRIQEAKAEAKRDGREVRDGEIAVACQQSCPAEAIVFGDLNDPESAVSKAVHDGHHATVLGELDVRPSISYRSVARNRADEGDESSHG